MENNIETFLKKELKEYFCKEFSKDPKVTDIKDDIGIIRF